LATGAKIAIHKDDGVLLKDSTATASKLFGKKAPDIKPDILLDGGEAISSLEVIHTPGHTPGGICLYDATTRTLFSGDTVFEDGSFGRTDLYGGNQSTLVESIRKLTLLDVRTMYPGHGDVVSNNANEQIKLSFVLASQF
jgi:glyoxylase-like metal-dependent hydrolase (beta-lactamase superfamily II)